MREAISVRRRVAIALWRLATNTNYRTVAHLFGVSQANVCDIIDLLPKYMKMPVVEELDENIRKFQSK